MNWLACGQAKRPTHACATLPALHSAARCPGLAGFLHGLLHRAPLALHGVCRTSGGKDLQNLYGPIQLKGRPDSGKNTIWRSALPIKFRHGKLGSHADGTGGHDGRKGPGQLRQQGEYQLHTPTTPNHMVCYDVGRNDAAYDEAGNSTQNRKSPGWSGPGSVQLTLPPIHLNLHTPDKLKHTQAPHTPSWQNAQHARAGADGRAAEVVSKSTSTKPVWPPGPDTSDADRDVECKSASSLAHATYQRIRESSVCCDLAARLLSHSCCRATVITHLTPNTALACADRRTSFTDLYHTIPYIPRHC